MPRETIAGLRQELLAEILALREETGEALVALAARVKAAENAPRGGAKPTLDCGHTVTPGNFGCPVCFQADCMRFGYDQARKMRGVQTTTLSDQRAAWRATNAPSAPQQQRLPNRQAPRQPVANMRPPRRAVN